MKRDVDYFIWASLPSIREDSERAAGAARKERGHETRGTCLDVRRVLSVHGEKSVKTGRRDEDPSYEKTLLSEYLR